MNKEQLLSIGVSEEVVSKVLELHKAALDGNYVPKVTFDAEREKVKNLNAAVEERDNQISKLKEFEGSAEQLTSKLEKLEETFNQERQQYAENLSKVEKRAAVAVAAGEEVYDIDDVFSKLDLEKVVLKDGNVSSGLKDQLDALRETHPHYFRTRETNNSLPNGWSPRGDKPKEGNVNAGHSSETDIGKKLAQEVLSDGAKQSAADIYFK